MKKYLTKKRIILLLILILILSINFYLRQRPYSYLKTLLNENITAYESKKAITVTDDVNQELNDFLYVGLNSKDTAGYSSNLKSSGIKYLKMNRIEIIKKSGISNKKDLKKFSKYMEQSMSAYFKVLDKYGEGFDIRIDPQRKFIER